MAKSEDERLQELRERQAQLKAKEMKIIALRKERERKADTRRKIIIGGIWLKYFPACRDTNPKDEANFAGVANAIATLANDPQFLRLWMAVQEKIRNGPAGSTPTGPVES